MTAMAYDRDDAKILEECCMEGGPIGALRAAVVTEAKTWIGTPFHHAARVRGAGVDCLIVNDGEAKQLTDEPNLVRAAQKIMEMGPRVVVVKFGEYGANMYTADGVFGIPAYPTADVVDPTGAGDTFAGGFVGYVAAHADEEITDELLRRAMAYGTALASFNVEAFGTEHGILTQAWSPIGGITSYRDSEKRSFDDPVIVGIGEKHGKSAAQVMLRWHLQQGRSAIPKSTRPQRIAENFDVFDFELVESELAAIDSLDRGVRRGPEPSAITLETFGREIPEA